MKQLQIIGMQNPAIDYIDRPTVKVLVLDSDNRILLINDGLLPGGGVEDNEDNQSALNRELREELGIEVTDVLEIGRIIQYRDFIRRKYIVYGYKSLYANRVADPIPQDEGEAQFRYNWYSIEDSYRLLESSISVAQNNVEKLKNDDTVGKLFNLMMTKLLLDSFTEG